LFYGQFRGFSGYGFPETVGVLQSPVFNIVIAGRIPRHSLREASVLLSDGKYSMTHAGKIPRTAQLAKLNFIVAIHTPSILLPTNPRRADISHSLELNEHPKQSQPIL